MEKAEPKAWERRPGESAPAFQALQIYLEMSPGRSLAKVGQRLGKSKVQIEKFSSRWEWVARTAAFDAYNDSIRESARAEALAAKAVDNAQKWANRQDQLNEFRWNTFSITGTRLANQVAEDKANEETAKAKGSKTWKKGSAATYNALIRDVIATETLASKAVADALRINPIQTEEKDFDPFDPKLAARANAALKAFEEWTDDG